MKWFLLAFKKYAQFSGRSRRKEFWMFTLFSIIIAIIGIGLDFSLDYRGNTGPISGTITLIFLLPSLSVGVRRMHDVGNNGTVYVIFSVFGILFNLLNIIDYEMGGLMLGLSIIILITAIISLVYLVRDSQLGINQYGPNPKTDELDMEFMEAPNDIEIK